eukprot:7412692-Alexandrium_andersonii.AAC.1
MRAPLMNAAVEHALKGRLCARTPLHSCRMIGQLWHSRSCSNWSGISRPPLRTCFAERVSPSPQHRRHRATAAAPASPPCSVALLR